MATALHAGGAAIPHICRRIVLRTNPKGAKAECVFTDGTSILLSNSLAMFIQPGDEVRFPLALEAAAVATEIQIRNTNRITRRQEIFQAAIGYATQPRKDRRGSLYVLAEVVSPCLGVSAVQLRCEILRDYFYVGNRNRAFDQQSSFYEDCVVLSWCFACPQADIGNASQRQKPIHLLVITLFTESPLFV
jgi:hypothetical protein